MIFELRLLLYKVSKNSMKHKNNTRTYGLNTLPPSHIKHVNHIHSSLILTDVDKAFYRIEKSLIPNEPITT